MRDQFSDDEAIAPIGMHRHVVADSISYAEKIQKNGWIDAGLTGLYAGALTISAYFLQSKPELLCALGLSGFFGAISFFMTIINLTHSARTDATARASIDARVRFGDGK